MRKSKLGPSEATWRRWQEQSGDSWALCGPGSGGFHAGAEELMGWRQGSSFQMVLPQNQGSTQKAGIGGVTKGGAGAGDPASPWQLQSDRFPTVSLCDPNQYCGPTRPSPHTRPTQTPGCPSVTEMPLPFPDPLSPGSLRPHGCSSASVRPDSKTIFPASAGFCPASLSLSVSPPPPAHYYSS